MGVLSGLTCWHCGSRLESAGARCTSCVPPVSAIELELPLYTINTHVRCVRCGYDLHGLPIEGTCAECQCPVRRSLELDHLGNADPQYLQSLRWGVTLMCAGCAFGAASAILIWLGTVFGLFSLHQTTNLLFVTSTLLMVAAGFYSLSRSDPAHRDARWQPDARMLARGLLVLLLISHVIMLLQQLNAGMSGSIVRARLLIVLTALLQAGFLSACVAYVRGLYIRIGNFWRADVARRFVWQIPILWPIGFCIPADLISLLLFLWLLWPMRRELTTMLEPPPRAAAASNRYAP